MPQSQQDKLSRLLTAVQDLSLARTVDDIAGIVRSAARELTESDGATFVLRDGDLCYYADEDAISPLWKGKRFPMSACISGWVMINKEPVTIEDIYNDERIPTVAYKPTFVKSLAMVPIRTKRPIGAIGNYWATNKKIEPDVVKIVQALADSTSVAFENVQLYSELERKVLARTAELESFSYAISHDLKAPLRSVSGFAKIMQDEFENQLPAEANRYLTKITESAARMNTLIEALLKLSTDTKGDIDRQAVNLSTMTHEILEDLKTSDPTRKTEFMVQDNILVDGDKTMLGSMMDNLLRNAWKFSRHTPVTRIEFGYNVNPNNSKTYFVKDNGAGFNPINAEKLFRVFQRLHSESQFEGTGIGLTTVQRIIDRHGGRVWAESKPGQGAQFYFEMPSP